MCNIIHSMEINEKIKKLRKEKGLTQPALASLCGWDNDGGQGRISHYETGNRKPSLGDLSIITAALGTTIPKFFLYGEDTSKEKLRSLKTLVNLGAPSPEGVGGDCGDNVTPAETKGLIPLISSVTAGKFCEAMDLLAVGDAIEWLPCPSNHSRGTFALKVEGDSMTSQYPGQRSYPSGMIIYVDPSKEVTNGARVVAKVPSDNESTFKLYVEDMGRKYLKPINTSYSSMDVTDIDFHICGVVIGAYMPE